MKVEFGRCWICKQPWDSADSGKKELASLKNYKRFVIRLKKSDIEVDVCPVCTAIIRKIKK